MTEVTTESTVAAKDEPKTVLANMESRRTFDNAEAALAYITTKSEELADFGDYPLIIAGLDDEGALDPTVYTDTMRVAVSVLTRKGSKEKKIETSVIAIVVFPVPTVESILADKQALEWLNGLVEKEINHIAVRNVRNAESVDDMEEARKGMPTSLAEYTTSQRETTGGILEVYNTLWQTIKKVIGTKFKAFAIANLSKKELRKGIESASYAAATYPTLENRTTKAGEPMSLFVLAANLGKQLAESKSLDPAFFGKALDTRDSKVIELDDEDEDAFDLDALMSAAVKTDEPAADSTAATAEPAAE